MSLSFDFPGWHWDENSQISSAKPADSLTDADHRWQHDLDELSGAEDEDQQQQQEDLLQQPTEPQRKRACNENAQMYSNKHNVDIQAAMPGRYVPDAVIQLVADRLGLQDVMAMARCCKAWHECLVVDSSDIWEQQEKDLFAQGWPWAPYLGAKPLVLPPSLGTNSLLHLKTTLSTSKVALQYFVMRKGYEYVLSGFEALWAALEPTQHTTAAAAPAADSSTVSTAAGGMPSAAAAAQQGCAWSLSPAVAAAAAAGGGACEGAADASPRLASSSSAELQATHRNLPGSPRTPHSPAAAAVAGQQQLAVTGGRQLQRLVDKLALHSWELTYSGYSTALAARCDELAAALRLAWAQQQQQQQQTCFPQPGDPGQLPNEVQHQHAVVSPTSTAAAAASGSLLNHSDAAAAAAAAAASESRLLPAAVLADCAGGILRDIESVAGGLGAGELLATEPELLLAATRRGSRPAAAIALWARLLPLWERYRRWLDLVTARCGLLGARVAAARQLAEPSATGPPNAALLPHLRNKGLLLFRGHVLLAYGLRRPLQEAALWLAAVAAVDAPAWRAGGGCSEADLELLLRVRKLLTELDVADGQDEEVVQHTHGKFRRCFGALLTKQRRSRCLPASAW